MGAEWSLVIEMEKEIASTKTSPGEFLDKDIIMTPGGKCGRAEQLVHRRENGVALAISKVRYRVSVQ